MKVVASAETGTGKTAAYSLPMLHRLYIQKKNEERRDINRVASPLAVVVCPTRELAEQVEDHIHRYSRHINGLKIVGVQGAMKDIASQIKELRNGVDILVATPGRLLTLIKGGESNVTVDDKEVEEEYDLFMDDDDDYIGEVDEEDLIDMDENEDHAPISLQKFNLVTQSKYKEVAPTFKSEAVYNEYIDLTNVKTLVLDEVDKMLAMGLLPEMKYIYKGMPRPKNRKHPDRMQVLMFTATLVPRINELIKRFAPYHIKVDLNHGMNIPQNVKQVFYEVGNRRKYALLTYLLRRKGSMKDSQVLVFCRTKQRVNRLCEKLKEEGFNVGGIHGDKTLQARQIVIEKFRKGEIMILVSTDVMARGMDIPNLPFVVNFDIPHNPEEYIHRAGRTGRAGASGTVYSLIGKDPVTIEIGGKVTEIYEPDYFQEIKDLLKAPTLHPTKVPGPWKDEDKNKSSNKKKNDQKMTITYSDESLKKYKFIDTTKSKEEMKKEVISQLIQKTKNEAEYKKRAKIGERVDKRPLFKKDPKLRDFKEGRYENALFEFDAKRARKLGIYVPSDLDAIREYKLKKFKKKVERKKKKDI